MAVLYEGMYTAKTETKGVREMIFGLFKRNTGWKVEKTCPECKTPLSDDAVYYNNGTCPHCGHTCNSTVADYFKRIYRYQNGEKVYKDER